MPQFHFVLRLNNIPLYGTCHIVFIHLSVDGHLDFLLWALVTNAAVNMGVQISLSDPAFSSFGHIIRGVRAGSCGNCIFKCLRNCHITFHSGCALLHYQEDDFCVKT